MIQEITQITHGNPVESLSDREVLVEILDRLRQLDEAMTGLFAAYSQGGSKGFRDAARRLTHARD